jgi:D-serine dehydratase
LQGIATFDDDRVLAYTAEMMDTQQMQLEPSATAGFAAVRMAQPYLASRYPMAHANHIVWATGGMLMPASEHERNYALGKAILERK